MDIGEQIVNGWGHPQVGGSSGGGSVNIFYLTNCNVNVSTQTNVSSNVQISGLTTNGGSGTVTISHIVDSRFEK